MNLFVIRGLPSFKKSGISFLILLAAFTSASACDICGCFMGITPYDNQSSISLLYRYRSFNGYHGQNQSLFPSGANFLPTGNRLNAPITSHNGDPSDLEVYRALEVRARYFLSKRIELNAIVPYNSNSERYNGNLNTVAGIGDVNIYSGYHLLRKLDQKKVNQRLIVGAGFKLPTGSNDATNFQGLRLSTLSQTGTGSTDGFIYFNYLIGYKRSGASLSSTYKMNGENAEKESIANSNTTFLNFFHNVTLSKKLQLVPSVQIAYEYSAGEKYNGVKTGEHRMNNLMTGIGADLFINNITLNMALQSKAWTVKDDHPMPAGRVVLGVTYNFNQLYYLLN
ncbi:MAG: transporter [Daejeonella sp.]